MGHWHSFFSASVPSAVKWGGRLLSHQSVNRHLLGGRPCPQDALNSMAVTTCKGNPREKALAMVGEGQGEGRFKLSLEVRKAGKEGREQCSGGLGAAPSCHLT